MCSFNSRKKKRGEQQAAEAVATESTSAVVTLSFWFCVISDFMYMNCFAVGMGGVLWLVDVSGARRTSPTEAAEHNLSAAREYCEAVLRAGTRYLPPREVLAGIERAESCSGLSRSLARSSRLGPGLRSKRGSRRSR